MTFDQLQLQLHAITVRPVTITKWEITITVTITFYALQIKKLVPPLLALLPASTCTFIVLKSV